MWMARAYNVVELIMSITANITNEGLCRAFHAALVLTGDAQEAEAAILIAVGLADDGVASDEGIFLAAVKASISRTYTGSAPTRGLDEGFPILPPELSRVARLTVDHRQFFVLRILIGLSRAECARLLDRDVREVDEGARAAMQELARIRQQEGVARLHLSSCADQLPN
jgi:tellurite resistance protein